MDREHLQHQLVLQMHHLHKHHPRRLYTHKINQKSLHPHSTHHQTHHKQQIHQTPVKTNANQSSQSSIVEKDQQRVPKSTDGTQVKRSKQQPRQQDERLCFHCNLPSHLKRNCPKIPYCSKCRTKGHTQDRCTNKSQRTRHARQAGESRDQQKRNEDLPQFSSRHNKCLQCAGDHQTAKLYSTQYQAKHVPLFLHVLKKQQTKYSNMFPVTVYQQTPKLHPKCTYKETYHVLIKRDNKPSPDYLATFKMHTTTCQK